MTTDTGDNVVFTSPGDAESVVVVDATGTIRYVSAGFDELLGREPGSTIGSSLGDCTVVDNEDRVAELLGPTGGMAQTRSVMLRARRADGLPLVLSLTDPAAATEARRDEVTLIAGRSGGPVRWAGEPAPPPSEHPAGVDHLLSHDARGALRNAGNFLNLFARKADLGDLADESVAAMFETGTKSVAGANEMLEQAVWYLRLEAMALEMRELHLASLLEQALEQSFERYEGDRSSLELDVVREIIDTLMVIGNEELLVWCLGEVITNARKFAGDAGRVVVFTSEFPVGDRARDLWISFTDSGEPIDPSLAPDAFRLGRMLQPRGTHPGVGMGLPLCRRILQRHAGSIHFETDPDSPLIATGKGEHAGTTVALSLPTPP